MTDVSMLDYVVPLLLVGSLILVFIIWLILKLDEWYVLLGSWWQEQDAKMRERDELRATRKSEPLIRLNFSSHPATDDADYVEPEAISPAILPEGPSEGFPALGRLDIMSDDELDIIKIDPAELVAQLARIMVLNSDGTASYITNERIALTARMRLEDVVVIIKRVRGIVDDPYKFERLGTRQSYKRVDVKERS